MIFLIYFFPFLYGDGWEKKRNPTKFCDPAQTSVVAVSPVQMIRTGSSTKIDISPPEAVRKLSDRPPFLSRQRAKTRAQWKWKPAVAEFCRSVKKTSGCLRCLKAVRFVWELA